MGAAVNALPGGEIVAAMDRGLIEAAEFNNATSDRVLGFADVSKICMLQSYHQNAEQLEISFNKTKFDALPEKMKAIIENAVEAASQDMSVEGDRPLLEGLHRAADQGQRQVLQDAGRDPQAPARDLRRGREEEGGAKIRCSRRSSSRSSPSPKRATQWEQDTVVSRKMAFDHYFGPNAKKPI